MSGGDPSSPYGSRPNTGAASLDFIIAGFPIGSVFTERQLVDEISCRGVRGRGAVGNHLRALQKRGHVERTDSGWIRLD